jgi:hypothetical protein
MAQPARRPEAADEAPQYDPTAIQRTLVQQRLRRQARMAHKQRRRHAHIRFFAVMLALLAGALALMLTVWHEIQRIFGL